MKPQLWLLIAEKNRSGAPLVAATLTWIAEVHGALLDSYFETERDGRLFAENGSTVIGGRHFQDFNYLCCRSEVKIIRYGSTRLFDSSIREFGLETLAEGDDPAGLYTALLDKLNRNSEIRAVLFAPVSPLRLSGDREIAIHPYIFPEVAYRKALFFPVANATAALPFIAPETEVLTIYPSAAELEALRRIFTTVKPVDLLQDDDTWESLTLRIAARWKSQARSVFFGDPAALACRIPAESRARSVPVFAPPKPLNPREIQVSEYTETCSAAADAAARLALEIGNPVIHGRQTLDGDIMCWSRYGVGLQIVDPSRPVFPVISEIPHVWAVSATGLPQGGQTDEITDAQLREWAHEGKILTSLIWHSGEIAHNEAMINLLEFAALNRFKMGIGVHAQRYETCPQLWELLSIPGSAGGVAEYVEPVLHSGGLGILAETFCPPSRLADHIRTALDRIEKIAGEAGRPRGYYAFLDTDLPTHSLVNPAIWRAAADAGMEYFISSACPGRNRILAKSGHAAVLNQTCRVLEAFSPFVRIADAVDLQRRSDAAPGWIIAALDAPVMAFNPYIWEKGHRLIAITNALRTGGQMVNVKPAVIARYAMVLKEEGYLPPVGVPPKPDNSVN